MQIITAAKSDKKDILRFYKSQNYSARFLGLDQCFLIKEQGAIIASVIVSRIEGNSRLHLLHALVVAQENRGNKLANQLLNHCIKVSEKYNSLICFADHSLALFYRKVGFSQISSESIDSRLTEHLTLRFKAYQKKQPNLQVFIFEHNNDKTDK